MMTSKPIQSVRMDESGRDAKKHSLVLDSFPSVPVSHEPGDGYSGGGSVRRNFVVTVDSMKTPGSVTTAAIVDAEKTARTNVLDGWKLTEDRQGQRQIPPDAERADSNVIIVQDDGSSIAGALGGSQSNKAWVGSKANPGPPVIPSNDTMHVTDRRRVVRLLPRKKQRQLPLGESAPPSDEMLQPAVEVNGVDSANYGPHMPDSLDNSIHRTNRVRQNADPSTRSMTDATYATPLKTFQILPNGSVMTETSQKHRLVNVSPNRISIYKVNNSVGNENHAGLIQSSEHDMSDGSGSITSAFQNRNQFMTSSLREYATHGRRIRRITSRRQLRHSMSEMGYGKLQSYRKLELIGEGTYATVYKGYSMLLEKMVALKEIRMEKTEGAPCTAIREISLLRYLRHANIVTLHDVVFTENSLTLVFEYIGQDLRHYMESFKNRLPMKTVKLFMFQIFRALEFCHASRILHRDLKPQNLLITKNQELKLADFGLARAKSIPTKTYSNEVATLWYRPPDVLLGDRNYTGHIDIWGAGCILYEMATGRTPFPGDSKDNQIKIIFEKLGIPPESYWPGLRQNEKFQQLVLSPDADRTVSTPTNFSPSATNEITEEVRKFTKHLRTTLNEKMNRLDGTGLDLLTECLHLLGSRRITAADALVHPYFDGILPKGVRVQDLSPEQSVVTYHEERNQPVPIRHKIDSNQRNFGLCKQLARSMEDVRVVDSSNQSEAYRKASSLQRLLKANSRSTLSVLPQTDFDRAPIAENGRYQELSKGGECERSRGEYIIGQPASPGSRSRSDHSSLSKSNGRHVTFEVVGYHESPYQNVAVLRQPYEKKPVDQNRIGHVRTYETGRSEHYPKLLTASDSNRPTQNPRGTQRQSGAVEIIRPHDKSANASRPTADTPIPVRSLNSRISPSSTMVNSRSKNFENLSKPLVVITNGRSSSEDADIIQNSRHFNTADKGRPNGFTQSHSPVMMTVERPYKPIKSGTIGAFETTNRNSLKMIPVHLNNQVPSYVRVKDRTEQKRMSIASGIDTDQLISTDDPNHMTLDSALAMLDRICQ